MEQDMEYRQQLISEYRAKVEPLLKYLTWLTQKQGTRMVSIYGGEGISENSVPFPVYDGTLMSFIKDAQKTGLLDRNYVYVYSRNRIRSVADEKRMIEQAELKTFDILTGILSKYVMGGMTKSTLWSQAVDEGIFMLVVQKMKDILEFWDKPLA
ncbi:MAG: hypothetical protein IJ282_00450 [Lachnospiraceae bacterium]|nr:hypothetical protein [Lachnospiraceae bacterium]